MKDNDSERATEPDNYELSETSNPHETLEGVVKQTGVKKAEAVALAWTKSSLYVAYAGYVAHDTDLLAKRQREMELT